MKVLWKYSRIENTTEVTLKLSSNVFGDSTNENNFPHKLLLTNTQVFQRISETKGFLVFSGVIEMACRFSDMYWRNT